MQLRAFSFLIDDNQPTDSKDTEKKNEKCSEIAAVTMAKTVNSVIHCNTNHHVMTFPFLILSELLERSHIFLEHNCCAKGDKFQSQSFVMLCRHCKRWLKYILITFQVLTQIYSQQRKLSGQPHLVTQTTRTILNTKITQKITKLS